MASAIFSIISGSAKKTHRNGLLVVLELVVSGVSLGHFLEIVIQVDNQVKRN